MIRIITRHDDPPWWAARTRRSLPAQVSQGIWHLRAGTWAVREAAQPVPQVSSAPCVLIGSELEASGTPTAAWSELLRQNGGIFTAQHTLPPVLSLWSNVEVPSDDLDAFAAHALAQGWPVFRHAPLDVCRDACLRVLQVITSLQRGGAERLALDLHEALLRQRIGTTLLTLGSPCRSPFPSPAGCIERRLPPDPERRADEIRRVAAHSGSDIIHAHLIDGDTLTRLDGALPLMTTFHNQRPGWPENIAQLAARPSTWLIGCSQAVTREIEQDFPQHTVRTIWNGITPPAVPARQKAARLHIVAIANPRPQKRLPLLIDILARLPGARLLVAGEASSVHEDAQREVELCRAKIAAHGLNEAVEWLGAVTDIPALLARADVLVLTSLHEGLSLAQLEALACGVPVVCTDAGGAAEVAARHACMVRVLPLDAPAADFAAAIEELATQRGDGTLSADFTTQTMAARHAWIAHAMLPRQQSPGGLLLVTNNFATGGAQSSARRLLCHFHARGMPVRAVVLQEHPQQPTPGTTALRNAGIDVLALDPPAVCEAQTALTPLLQQIAASPPEAVLFWNVIPEYKLLLADALHDCRVFDVSPGEMYFASLERYFVKPRPGLPYSDAAAYGARLSGIIVKHSGEIEIARTLSGCPVHSIANGVPVRPFRAETSDVAWTLGTAARLHPHKRLDDLLAAFRLVHARHPQVRLRIAGGPDADQEEHASALQQLAHDLPVEWCGEIDDIAAFHDTLSVFVMISEPIGCPNASLEAMASSLPVIATAVGGAREQIDNGVSGLLTPPRDADALASAIEQLLTSDAMRARMRIAAHERASRLFSLETMAERYAQILFNVHSPTQSERQTAVSKQARC